MSIFVKTKAVPQRAPCDTRGDHGVWRRWIASALPLFAAALTLMISSDLSFAAGANAGCQG